MEDLSVVFCPDCGIYYLKEKDQKTGEERYAYADDFVEISAKKIDDNIYQCADCGALFELDPHTFENSKLLLNRTPRYSEKITFDAREWNKLFDFDISKVSSRTGEAFFDYLARVSNDVSWYNDAKNKTKEEKTEQIQKQ
jgi:DNA-directed RNA polymerase subunit RPC12/RpoP